MSKGLKSTLWVLYMAFLVVVVGFVIKEEAMGNPEAYAKSRQMTYAVKTTSNVEKETTAAVEDVKKDDIVLEPIKETVAETTRIVEQETTTLPKETTNTSKERNTTSANTSQKQTTKAYSHYCEADGCYKEGTHKEMGFNGYYEYYCDRHWQQIQDIISMMEEDVGSDYGHTCEECSKAGTHEIIGISGLKEYYCTEHYNEMIEILEMMLEGYK